MKLRRFSKSVAALMTAMMLATSVPVTAFAENGTADMDATEEVTEEASDETTEEIPDIVIEEVTESETEETTQGEITPDVTQEEFEEDVEEAEIDGMSAEGVLTYFGDIIYYYMNSGMNMDVGCDNEYFTYTSNPIWWPSADYKAYYNSYGIGYFMENKFNTKPQVISNDGKLALGNIQARIEEKNGAYYLHLNGCYEFAVDVWNGSNSSGLGQTKYFSLGDPYGKLGGSEGSLEGLVTFREPEIRTKGTDGKDAISLPDIREQVPDGGRKSGAGVWYGGPSGVIPIKWKVNGKSEVDLLRGTPCAKKGAACPYYNHYTYPSGLVVHTETGMPGTSVHEELSVDNPSKKLGSAGLKSTGEAYYGTFDKTFDLGLEYGTATGKEKVDKLVITEIMGVPVRMYVYPNSYELFVPELIETVGIVDTKTAGENIIYTIQLDTNAAVGGDYTFECSYGSYRFEKVVGIVQGRNSQQITVTVPKRSGGKVFINSIYLGTKSSNGREGKELAYIDSISREVRDLRFNINFAKGFSKETVPHHTSQDGFYVTEEDTIKFDYSVNTIGKYTLCFAYDDGTQHTASIEVDLRNPSGTVAATLSRIPSELRELRLVSATSPDGYTIYYKNSQIIYRNDALFPADRPAPKKFDAAVNVTSINESSNLIYINADVNYEAPKTDADANMVVETMLNGTVSYKKFKFGVAQGYHTYHFDPSISPNNQAGIYAGGNLSFDSNTEYVKLLYIEGTDGTILSFDQFDISSDADSKYTTVQPQYLYCKHVYDPDVCDADCNRCGAIRTDLPHDFSEDCTSCSKCGAIRRAHPNANDDSIACPDCGKILIVGWYYEEANDEWHFVKEDGTYLKNEWALDGDKVYYFDINGNIATSQWINYKSQVYYVDGRGIMKTGWAKINEKQYYFGENGVRKTGIRVINDKVYEFDSKGVLTKQIIPSGWFDDSDGEWYYFKSGGILLKNDWAKFDGKWNYVGEDGRMVTDSWVSYKNDWYYVNVTGDMVTGWKKIDGEQRYFGTNGAMVYGIATIDGKTYEFDRNGVLKQEIKSSGWLEDEDGEWYYVQADGTVLKNGWAKFDGKWNYVGKDGRIVTDSWVQYKNDWYYVNVTGDMITGWAKIGGNQYYLGTDGAMRTGTVAIDGKTYQFASNGVLVKEIVQSEAGNQQSSDKKNGLIEEAGKTYYYVNDVKQLGWKKVDNAWYNFGTNGVMAKNKWVADGKDWFYCGADGKMVTKKWISYKNDWYYFGADGAMVTDKWVSYQNNWYYFNASGIMVTSKWVQYKNDWYYVDADGIMVTGKQVINGKTYNFNSSGVWVN